MRALKNLRLTVGVFALIATISAGPTATVADDHKTPSTSTPVKHVVVIFQENVSFDHYFGTYPNALNPSDEPNFTPSPNTPLLNGLTPALLTTNPNAASAGNPFRLDRSQALTCDQDHDYTDEQKAYDDGLLDMFILLTCDKTASAPHLVMGYYDGNTVTALWNYAQNFAMNDNSFGSTYGPSTPGALNLIAGNTNPVIKTINPKPGNVVDNSVIGDPDPFGDDCSAFKRTQVRLSGFNIGDLLNAQGITWGWFEGGFRPSSVVNGTAACATAHKNIGGTTVTDYIPHHQPFQYYASTINPHHTAPSSVDLIGTSLDGANHQYDLQDFIAAAHQHNLPAVSFLKAAAYQDGHAGYSDPLDEQTFLVETINMLESLPEWNETAIIIAYDDSDGWYDHQYGGITNPSASTADALTAPGECDRSNPDGIQGRCGPGPRLPLLLISPFAKENFVDDTFTIQTSIMRFIEDNWGLGQVGGDSFDATAGSLMSMFDFSPPHKFGERRLFLDASTGEPVPPGQGM